MITLGRALADPDVTALVLIAAQTRPPPHSLRPKRNKNIRIRLAAGATGYPDLNAAAYERREAADRPERVGARLSTDTLA
jgi:hypothetical protein